MNLPQENGDKLSSSRNTVFFNASKKELFLPNSGFKTLQSRLKHHWTIGVQRDDITPERLKGAKLIVFGGPRDKFTAGEVKMIFKIRRKFPLIFFSSTSCVSTWIKVGASWC